MFSHIIPEAMPLLSHHSFQTVVKCRCCVLFICMWYWSVSIRVNWEQLLFKKESLCRSNNSVPPVGSWRASSPWACCLGLFLPEILPFPLAFFLKVILQTAIWLLSASHQADLSETLFPSRSQLVMLFEVVLQWILKMLLMPSLLSKQ